MEMNQEAKGQKYISTPLIKHAILNSERIQLPVW